MNSGSFLDYLVVIVSGFCFKYVQRLWLFWTGDVFSLSLYYVPQICVIQQGHGVQESWILRPGLSRCRRLQVVDVDGGEGGVRSVGVDLHVGGGRGGGQGRPVGRLRVARGGDHPQSRRRL